MTGSGEGVQCNAPFALALFLPGSLTALPRDPYVFEAAQQLRLRWVVEARGAMAMPGPLGLAVPNEENGSASAKSSREPDCVTAPEEGRRCVPRKRADTLVAAGDIW
jgi:hypothetical protein